MSQFFSQFRATIPLKEIRLHPAKVNSFFHHLEYFTLLYGLLDMFCN